MPVSAASIGMRLPRFSRRVAVTAIGVVAAAALSVATLSNTQLGQRLGRGLGQGINGMETVAAMLAARSPGERPEGALAQLKHKRQAALHERALPAVRGPGPTAYEALAGPPSPPIAPPPEGPLYAAVAGQPTPIIPVTGGGGPPILSNIPLPGGGGGGAFAPPVAQSTPETPPTPVTPVPEPASWAMMILGFALMARVLRRRGPAGFSPAPE